MEYNEDDTKTINQALKNNEIKNIELGYPNEKKIEAVKKINQQRRRIIWHYKVAMELKKANESYKLYIS